MYVCVYVCMCVYVPFIQRMRAAMRAEVEALHLD